MLCEWRWHSVMCVHRPVECEGRIPPLSQAERLHAQPSEELRDSDGSELIYLCCWCYACFIFGNGGWALSLSLSIYMPIYIFRFASAYLSVCLSLNLSFFPFLSCHPAVAVGCCCECVLQAKEAESTFFNGRVIEGHTEELQTEFAVWNAVRCEASIVSGSIHVPGPSMEGRWGFRLPP